MPSDRKFAFVLGGALLCALAAVPSPVHAFCRATTQPMGGVCPEPCSSAGLSLAWGTRQIEYALSEQTFVGLDDALVRGALARSFAQWTAATCDGKQIGFEFAALPQRTPLTIGPEQQEPNLNVISALSASQWSALGLDPHTFAKTQLWFDTGTGEIVGADVAFNASIGTFAVCSDVGCPPDVIDLENVATHEFGHFLGLAHSADPASTMWCDAVKGDLQKRTLASDDQAGLCAIYGSGTAFIDPMRTVEPTSDPKSASAGCAAGAPEDGLSSWTLVLLAMLVSYRRRRSTRTS